MLRRLVPWAVALACAVAIRADARSFWAFETGPVRPIALLPGGATLVAVNTPDNRLEVFDVSAAGLTHRASVPVGLEPCALAARSASEVWVVNHLSDSISVVDLAGTPRVIRTLQTGDEPRDIVFAGPGRGRAFVTTAARGQNHPSPAPPLTPGVGRASVFVFDAAAAGSSPSVLTLFGDTPRALAASPDGSKVYAAVFHSGNRSAVLGVPASNGLPTLPPTANADGVTAPAVGRIVKFDGSVWRDALGGALPPGRIPFALPDFDVFEIDASAPVPVANGIRYSSVGTVLFNMATHPQTGVLYVSNTDANNLDRFEGSSAAWGSLRGELHRARISVIDGTSVLPRHLNKHLAALPEYAAEGVSGASDASLATPTDLALSADGSTLYVAAFGSGKVGVFSTAALEADSFQPDPADHIELGGGGPGGLALDEPRGRLYVWTRFENAIAIVDLATRREIGRVGMHDPEPPVVRDGRNFLYDARLTSSNGEASCSACHVFGDFDGVGWDLGDPDGAVVPNPNPFVAGIKPPGASFHPLKGPMTTQTLRGMANHGPMHWRGDRTGASVSDPGGAFDEQAAFEAFDVAFAGLLGRSGPLGPDEMSAFARFALELVAPPNPVRNLDNSLTAEQQAGQTFYLTQATDGPATCNACHALAPGQGFFGGNGQSSIEGEPQEFKIPQLRNMYAKLGRFDVAGPQIRGFGYLHDGAIDTLLTFLRAPVFQFPGGDAQRLQVADFLLAFPSGLAPIVGQQVTLTANNAALAGPRIARLIARARAPFALAGEPGARECDLVVKGNLGGAPRGWLYDAAADVFVPDAAADAPLADAALRALAATPGQELTYTCAPPGSGPRIALDRDADGQRDADDNCPEAAPASQADDDDDGLGAACDNCAHVANADQADAGGWGTGSLADGQGDACQCGDATDDGVVTQADVDQLRGFLVGSAALGSPFKCSVVGDAGCDVADSAAMRRRLVGSPVALALQSCAAALSALP